MWLPIVAAALAGCATHHPAAGHPSQAAGPGPPASAAPTVGVCRVRTVDPAPARIAVTRVKVGFWHGEDSIQNVIALADGSFIVVAQTPGTSGYDNGPGQDHVYQVSASGRVLAQRHDWEGDMMGSPVDLSYFFSAGPGARPMWRDPAGVSHPVSGASPGIYFRDTVGRFWWYVRSAHQGPSGLWVSNGPADGGRPVAIGQDQVGAAVAGCDGTVWALAVSGDIWRIGDDGRTARVVTTLPAGGAGPAPQWDGAITALSDGSIWILAANVDQSSSGPRLVHVGPSGVIGAADAATAADASVMAEGPDGALWLSSTRGGLLRLSGRGEVQAYPAPATQNLALDAAGRLWFACAPDLCLVTTH